MVIEITLLLAAGLGNLAWDVTGRRLTARARRRERRSRRSAALPLPAADESAADPFQEIAAIAPASFVEHTRVVVEELDRVVDHFDLVLLRAHAGESLVGDIVYVGGDVPRLRARELLERWLASVTELPGDLQDQLRAAGLPDSTLANVLERELERSRWPNVDTSVHLLEATATDLERAVVLIVTFLHTLTANPGDPYR